MKNFELGSTHSNYKYMVAFVDYGVCNCGNSATSYGNVNKRGVHPVLEVLDILSLSN